VARSATRIAGRAREWLSGDREGAFLLRGADLTGAEAWLADQGAHRQHATNEQVEYILASRRAAGRRARRLVAALATGLAVAIGLAIFALIQRQDAINAQHTAESRLLATEAPQTAATNLQLASLQALEGYALTPTIQAASAIHAVAADPQLGSSVIPDGQPVTAVAYSPDGRMLATASGDTIRLWNATTHSPIVAFRSAETRDLSSVAFVSGTVLDAGSGGGEVSLWDIAHRRELFPALQIGAPVRQLTSQGPIVVVGDSRGELEFWNQASRSKISATPAQPASVGALAVSGDHRFVAVSFAPVPALGTAGTLLGEQVLIINTETGASRTLLLRRPATVAEALAFGPDDTLAVGEGNGTIALYDPATGAQTRALALTGFNGASAVAFGADGSMIASGGDDDVIHVWNTATGRQIEQFTGDTSEIDTLAFSPSCRVLASGSFDGSLRYWSIPDRRELGNPIDDAAVAGPANAMYFTALSRNGAVVAGSGGGTAVGLWRVASRSLIATVPTLFSSVVRGFALNPGGSLLAVSTPNLARSGAVERLFHVPSGVPDGGPIQLPTPSVAAAFSPDGRELAVSGEESLVLLSVTTRQVLRMLPLAGGVPVVAVAFSPNGRLLAAGGESGEISLWNAATGRPVGVPISGDIGKVNGLAFAPNSSTLASADGNGTAEFWSVGSHGLVGLPIIAGTGPVNDVAFSPDGRTLATADTDGTVRLRDVASHVELGTALSGPTNAVEQLAFTPNGRELISASEDGTLRFWSIDTLTRDRAIDCGYVGLDPARVWMLNEPSIPYQTVCGR
jgi:WD40 repeat protein